jgi:hypothetical protein
MAEPNTLDKSNLLAAIDRSWIALNAALKRLTESQLTTIRDVQGWTVKDHIVHMTRWERSVVFFLQHLPRHDGLGVEETLYLQGSEDAINATIYRQASDLVLGDALLQFRENHRRLLELLAPLTDADLQKRYRDFLPDEPGDGDGPPAIDVIHGNTAHHFAEHLGWIEALVNKPR